MLPLDNPLLQRLRQDPGICNGKPRVKNTRLSVELLRGQLSQGATPAELLEDYPELTPADLQACLAYAGQQLQQTRPTTLTPPPAEPARAEIQS